MEEIRKLLEECLDGGLYRIVLSGAKKKEDAGQKKKVRPVMVKGELLFQVSSYVGKQIFHDNLTAQEAAETLAADLAERFGQMQVETNRLEATVLVSKKGKVTVRRKLREKSGEMKADLSHNRAKKYILQEGRPVPFLVDLGVQTAEGKTVNSRYDKFRQINRFLEFIEDVWPILPKDRPVRIIDFGCGKSYLTFAMYYFLHELKGLSLQVTGLDLKEDVIENCSRLARRYGYEGLRFLCGDIADYTGTDRADMVVTLHACDTATDYALYKAMKWQAKVILSVPCCQHEMNGQIACGPLEGALRYGLIRERLSALFTDALRADLLEENGYDTQVLEFIDMEHTPKNILLRAVRRENAGEDPREKNSGADSGMKSSQLLSGTLHARITLQRLLDEERGEGN